MESGTDSSKNSHCYQTWNSLLEMLQGFLEREEIEERGTI